MALDERDLVPPTDDHDVEAPRDLAQRGSLHRSEFNAWFFDTFDRYINFITHQHKRVAFEGIEPGRILEIGAGTGANFSYLPDGCGIVALEPNVEMHERLRRRAVENGRRLELLAAPAETIPLEDDSVDTVICTLVLCTVHDPQAVLREIRRVLRPGGTFRFVEHVAASPVSPRRWLQRVFTRPWAWIFEGCQLCRHTGDTISQAGFATIQIDRRRLRLSVFIPVNAAISGIATNEPGCRTADAPIRSLHDQHERSGQPT